MLQNSHFSLRFSWSGLKPLPYDYKCTLVWTEAIMRYDHKYALVWTKAVTLRLRTMHWSGMKPLRYDYGLCIGMD